MTRSKPTGPKGRLTRRDFLKITAMTGAGIWAASGIMQRTPPLYAVGMPPRRGGVLTVAGEVGAITHPAEIRSTATSNIVRQVAQCLTSTDAANRIRPLLLESWVPGDDLRTWTLTLRKEIRFNNGDKLTADDVAFTIRQWLALPPSSPLRQIFELSLSPGGVEPLTDLKVRLHLDQPMIDLPANLSHPCAVILNHRTFEGDFLKAPHGTGPFYIETFRAGERCSLKRRNSYWQTGEDQKPLPYLDRVEFIDSGMDTAEQAAALNSGEADIIDSADAGTAHIEPAAIHNSHVTVYAVPSSRTHLLRMHVDQTPWRDNRVRLALKFCQDREKILSSAYLGEGEPGQDFHVSPVHQEYCKRPVPSYQPDRAKTLLRQAGYENGLDVALTVNPHIIEAVRYAEILRDHTAVAGLRIHLTTADTPPTPSVEKPASLEIVPFPHYPGATTPLALAYNTDPYGYPVHGNETNWKDAEFSELLSRANTTVDLEARRDIFCRLEDIMQQRGPVGNACWLNAKRYARKRVNGISAHPGQELNLDRVWLAG